MDPKNPIELVTSVCNDVEGLFSKENLSQFTDDVGLFATNKLPCSAQMTSNTAKLYHYLKVSELQSTFRKLVVSYISLAPHSAGPERAVSVHSTLKTTEQT